MKLFNRRVAFLISDQHLIPHGGIGQFAKGFAEMCSQLNWKVDILLDKAPTGTFSNILENAGANIIWPLEPLRYTNHTSIFAFSDTTNFEKVINFRNVLFEAFEENIYDLIVCNTQESMTAAYAMTVHKYIPVVFYTHLHSMIFRETRGSDVFLDSYHNFYNKHMEFADVIIGTQSQKNIDELTKYNAVNCALLPMPMPERELLNLLSGPKSGVLFIGRWEEGKNPAAYIRAMKECKLPCKVMTNSNGAKKFEKAFSEAGITDYEIKVSITGQEKVDFIKGSKVHFNPSLRESYGIAFLECLGHMPCVVLDTQNWSDNFNEKYFRKVNIKNAAETILELYNSLQPTEALDYVRQLDNDVSYRWIALVDNFVSKRSNMNAGTINTFNTVKYSEYLKDLNRAIGREDIETVLSNKYKFINILYTDSDTYLSKDPIFLPEEVPEGTNLFHNL